MITPTEMLKLEKEAGVPVKRLMDNVGKKVYEQLKNKFELTNKRVVIICGHGNNGGDGFATANYLRKEVDTKIIFIGKEEKLGKEANFYYQQTKDLIKNDLSLIDESDIIIDAMLGTGVKGELREPLRSVIGKFNKSRAFKVSIDIPTGLNPNTGEILDKVVNPELIVALHDTKPGLDKFDGKVIVVDIGLKTNGRLYLL